MARTAIFLFPFLIFFFDRVLSFPPDQEIYVTSANLDSSRERLSASRAPWVPFHEALLFIAMFLRTSLNPFFFEAGPRRIADVVGVAIGIEV